MSEKEKRKEVLSFLKSKGHLNQAENIPLFVVVDYLIEWGNQSRPAAVSGSLPVFSRQDMIDFANRLYKDIADLPGHEADDKYLDDFLSEQQ